MITFVILVSLASVGLLLLAYREASRYLDAKAKQALVLRYSSDKTFSDTFAQRSVSAASLAFTRVFDRARIEESINGVLELADVKVKPGIAIAYAAIADFILLFLFNTFTGSLLLSQFWALVLIGFAGWSWVNSRQKKRRSTFEKSLPDFLMMLASSLRAGLSLQRGIEAVSSEGDGEVERQLRRASTEMAMGVQPDEALAEVAGRMKSTDMQWVVVAIGIQRKVGGNLASVLDVVADTIRGRETIRREVRAVSAEGRMSANVLVALPIGVFFMLVLTRREYAEILWTTSTGRMLLFTVIALITAGMMWVRSMVSLD